MDSFRRGGLPQLPDARRSGIYAGALAELAIELAHQRYAVGQHGAAAGAGYRNGYRTGRLKTAEGMVEYGAPQIADRVEPFRSKLRTVLAGRTEELEGLAVEMYARGLSTRDIEAVFADESGGSLLSRSAVSTVTERLWAEYEAFASRDLSEFEIAYLFVDGIAERLHLGQPREAVQAAWGVAGDGKKIACLNPFSLPGSSNAGPVRRRLTTAPSADCVLLGRAFASRSFGRGRSLVFARLACASCLRSACLFAAARALFCRHPFLSRFTDRARFAGGRWARRRGCLFRFRLPGA